jgi:hypothetical protein
MAKIKKQIERRYKIEGGPFGEYFIVESGMEAEFEAWIQHAYYGAKDYEGLDYSTRSLGAGYWTFTDPRMD